MLTRRTLLRQTALSTAVAISPWGWASAPPLAEQAETALKSLRVADGIPLPLPPDFIGLGYEMSSVATMGLLSPANTRYLRLVQQLGARGVLRVGGIVADYTRYQPDGTSATDRHNTVITRAALQQFAAFLKALNWTAIWSVNFAQGTLADAVIEATAVAQELGSSLQALELGNEVENYGRGNTFRNAPYTFDQYHAEYTQWRAAILRAAPGVRFAAPDTAESVDWVENMAADAHGDVQLLTTHYYRNGQKQGSAEQLTHVDPRLPDKLARLRVASQRSGIPWRMCETNSFSGGGLPGVSDTMLGALWTLDFMCLLAARGCSGVNIETGVNQLGFVSCYSPIQDDGHGNNTAGPSYYGMLAFAAARAGCSETISLELPPGEPDLTAYGFGDSKVLRSVVLVNRSAHALQVSTASLGLRAAAVQRLTGPAADSRTGITFAGAPVDPEGRWAATTHERLVSSHLTIASMSAVVLRSE